MLAWGSCGRKGRKVVQEEQFEQFFKTGKPSSITFNVGAPTFLSARWVNPAPALVSARLAREECRPSGACDYLCLRTQCLRTGLISAAPLALFYDSHRTGMIQPLG